MTWDINRSMTASYDYFLGHVKVRVSSYGHAYNMA